MKKNLCTVIIRTGRYVPSRIIDNSYFLDHTFYDENGELHKFKIEDRAGEIKTTSEIVQEFERTTGIYSRRYAEDHENTLTMGCKAAEICLENSDPEKIDRIDFAHNFGIVDPKTGRIDTVPKLSSRVKEKLGIKNRNTRTLDLYSGCAGWIHSLIETDAFFKAGFGKISLNIGADTVDRVGDPYDRDSMIYASAGAAAILKAVESNKPIGILSHVLDCGDSSCTYVMRMEQSNYPGARDGRLYFKMFKGRDVQKYAIKFVSRVIKKCVDDAGLHIKNISKFVLHQTNVPMDEAIVYWTFKKYGMKISDSKLEQVLPMTVQEYGNSSTATIGVTYDMMLRGELKGHRVQSGDNIVFAAVGGGDPTIAALVYRVP